MVKTTTTTEEELIDPSADRFKVEGSMILRNPRDFPGVCFNRSVGRILARKGDLWLMWDGGTNYTSGQTQVYAESSLEFSDAKKGHGGKILSSGGRLSAALVEKHIEEIAKVFGEHPEELGYYLIPAVRSRKTLTVAENERMHLGTEKCDAIIDALHEFPTAPLEDAANGTCGLSIMNFMKEVDQEDIDYIMARVRSCYRCKQWFDKIDKPIGSYCEPCMQAMDKEKEERLISDGIAYLKKIPDAIRLKIISAFCPHCNTIDQSCKCVSASHSLQNASI